MPRTALILDPELLNRQPQIIEWCNPNYLYVVLSDEMTRHIVSHGRQKSHSRAPGVSAEGLKCGRLIEMNGSIEDALRQLKDEHGVDRIIRISPLAFLNPFLRHTPFSSEYPEVISLGELREIQKEEGWEESQFLDDVLQDYRKEDFYKLMTALFGLLIMGGFIFALSPPGISFAIRTFPPIVVTTLSVIVGGLLFAFRSRWRLAYGTLEAGFGVVTVTYTVLPWPVDFRLYLQVLAGLYIIVRGLDNLDKSRLGQHPIWRRLFSSA